MTIFAKSFSDRVMTGNWATIFIILNLIITVVPIAIITWVLYLLFKQTFAKYRLANLILGSSFAIIWGIVFWMINRDMNSTAYVVQYDAIETIDDGKASYAPITEATLVPQNAKLVAKTQSIIEPVTMKVGDELSILKVKKKFIYLDQDKQEKIRASSKDSPIIKAKIVKIKESEVEIPASWFSILNSLFIILFAPLFSKWWESKYNPDASVKYGLGLILLGVGFGALAFGSMSIPQGAQVASVSVIWLVLAYLFHTLGELCLSPVALSYISKLVPGRMIALMFGVWYIAVAIGNKTAGKMGGEIEKITAHYSMTTFFLIFTLVPAGLGLLAILLNPVIKKLMHGVK